MNAQYIQAVSRGTMSILSNHFGLTAEVQRPTATKDSVPSNDISVVLGVSGEISGQIICSLSIETAKGIVGIMMGGLTIDKLDDMGWSAVQEFGNWIAGSTSTELFKAGITTDVTPPVVNDGHSKFRSTKLFITVPLATNIGVIDVHISLSDVSA